jgi:hypothetical protein
MELNLQIPTTQRNQVAANLQMPNNSHGQLIANLQMHAANIQRQHLLQI